MPMPLSCMRTTTSIGLCMAEIETLPPVWVYFRALSRRLAKTCRMRAGSTFASHIVSKWVRSEEHTSELQSQFHLVCRLLLEKKWTRRRDQRCHAGFSNLRGRGYG